MDAHEKRNKMNSFRVGLLSVIALGAIITGIIFAGGDKGLLFAKRSIVHAKMFDVGGLKTGCPVTIGGMTIGKVLDIHFDSDISTTQIEVTMEVRDDVRRRIKADSVPSIRTQGMLGDRYIEISMGSNESPVLAEGQALNGEVVTDFDEAVSQANSVLAQSEKLLVAINQQQGTMGQLVYDSQLYTRIIEIADELKAVLQDFKKQPRRYLKFSVF